MLGVLIFIGVYPDDVVWVIREFSKVAMKLLE